MRLFAEPAIREWAVGVDAAIAQERPVAANVFTFCGVALDDQNFFLIVGGFGDELAERISHERIPPKFQAGVTLGRVAFVAHAIYDRDVNTISNGVGALDGAPGVELGCAELGFFFRMPANAGRVER